MPIEKQVNKDHPLMRAWEKHKSTDEHKNSRRWALKDEHVDGSLWASFMAGWNAAMNQMPWSDNPPERDGDFFYSGETPNGRESLVCIAHIATHPDGERWASVFLPVHFCGNPDRRTAMVHYGKLDDWPGQWAGPEFGLTTVVR